MEQEAYDCLNDCLLVGKRKPRLSPSHFHRTFKSVVGLTPAAERARKVRLR
jgi:methylphosphotriester-DNA--protein-cysteine methyltransferase